MPASEPTFSALIRQLPPAVRPIVEAARRAVTSVAADAREVPYRGGRPRSASTMWKLARYGGEEGHVVGIGAYSRHAMLFFYRGRELDDGTGLLEGSGRVMRFVRLHTPADAEAVAVQRLLRRAFRLGGGLGPPRGRPPAPRAASRRAGWSSASPAGSPGSGHHP